MLLEPASHRLQDTLETIQPMTSPHPRVFSRRSHCIENFRHQRLKEHRFLLSKLNLLQCLSEVHDGTSGV